ncbi:toxin-antitoxin system TumE family protein [Azospirillum sp. A39]|uniref:toxin-antitoxin system TumE family protein n=1 Tax=Azospirillum sp. A39 TaxID=3462279 RepID=UPI004045D1D7
MTPTRVFSQHTGMRATLVIRRRVVFGDRDFAEMVVWRVPQPVPPTTHGFTYRLAYIVDGRRVIGFDNEWGKGDLRHVDGREEPYHFSGVESLLADVLEAVAAWRRDHG